ncbi:MAG: hypothetical protein WBC73_11925, partial [Phormidesmis sp.]
MTIFRAFSLLASVLWISLFTIVMPMPAIAVDNLSATESVQFDVNDISFLWPVPTSSDDVNALISSNEKTADGTSQLWPQAAFNTVIQTAQEVEVQASPGSGLRKINFEDGQLGSDFRQQETWKIVSVRVDPSAPGSSREVISEFGSIPQIRLIVQPVTVDGSGNVQVHDYTAHLVYNFTQARSPKAVPDRTKFKEIVNDLKQLKVDLAVSGVSTTGKRLDVHPGFKSKSPDFRDNLEAFLKKHLSEENLFAISFMGLEPPEPWIFFAMAKRGGSFIRVSAPTLGSNQAQMLSFVDSSAVSPRPVTKNVDGKSGVSTAVLFEADAQSKLTSKSFPDRSRPLLQDIPDIIANPERSHFFNTDCVSCHSESARRQKLGIPTKDALFQSQLPKGISGVNAAVLPKSDWNVRNFGWFPDFFNNGAT